MELMITARELAKIWRMYEEGDLSRNNMSKKVKALCEHEPIPQPEIKHWPGRYEPDGDTSYWTINTFSQIEKNLNNTQDLTDEDRRTGVCCKTAAEAEFVQRQKVAYLELVDLIRELNGGWRPVWEDEDESKCYFYYDHEDGDINYVSAKIYQEYRSELYMKPGDACEEVLKRLGKEKIKLALWDEFVEHKT